MPLVNSEDKNQPGTAIANTKTRVVGYDIAKVLAMFLVVLLHYSFYVGSIPDSRITRAAMTITVVCVPTFITVNGAILLNKPLNVKKHARKLLRVAMLLFIWRGIHIVAYRILGSPASASRRSFPSSSGTPAWMATLPAIFGSSRLLSLFTQSFQLSNSHSITRINAPWPSPSERWLF